MMLLCVWGTGLSIYLLIKLKLPSHSKIYVSIILSLLVMVSYLGIEFSVNAYTLEGDLLASYGFENETYEYVDGKPQFTEFMYKNPDGLSLAEAYHYYAKLGGAGLYHWDREFAGMDQNDLDAMAAWQTENDGAYVLPPTAMTADEASEYASIMNDIETYRSEMVIRFILGTEPIENYDDFVDTIKSMNIEKAIEIQQAALDRFNAR